MRAQKLSPQSHRIGFYIRVSTEEQAENPEGSIKNQEQRLRMAVKLKNMEGRFGDIKAVFIDRAKSGKDTNRPELQKLLLAIRKQEIDLVMVTELSRISRSIKDFSGIWELMLANQCGFSSLRENFDTTTAAGEMVLFTVANIAQFERRQISERVSANFNVRSQRGLFNGGSIPFGYKRIEDRPGFLAIDEEAAPLVKAAFSAFIREGSLMPAAKWLNEQGFRMKREREGGGNRVRMGFFTVGNLKPMLKNKFYIGVKCYLQKGEAKESEAVWPAIIEKEIFDKVNDILTKNYRRKKDTMENRYPYQLVGLLSCKTCGDRMVGKSAHGRNGKIGYYEHGWSTIKGSYVPGLKHQCAPYRILAKKIEPVLWNEVLNLCQNKLVAEEILKEAKKAHILNPGSKEVEKCNRMIFSSDQQLDVLAERLASLPQTISPTPVYKQMEKLEGHKREAEARLAKLRETGVIKDQPAEMKDFERFLTALGDILREDDSLKTRMRVIRAVVRRVLVIPEGFEIYFKVGETHVKIFMNDFGGAKARGVAPRADFGQKNRAGDFSSSPSDAPLNFQKNLGVVGSNTCVNGRPLLGKGHFSSPTTYFVDNIQISALPKYLNKSFLHEKYVVNGLPAKEIADLLGCSTTTVKAHLSQFGLSKGGRGRAVHKEKLAYGTRLVGHQLVSHKGEAQVVATIKKMYAKEGLRPKAIAELLDTMRVPTKRQGKKWDHSVVISILKREGIYKKSRNSPRKGDQV